MADLKDLVKPPFANYDIVVYFGCGLFSLPLINHYIVEPTGFRFPSFRFEIGSPFAAEAVSALSLLFSVYLLGHLIAFTSGLLTEKFIDSLFGKVSSAILIPNILKLEQNSKEIISSFIYKRVQDTFSYSKIVPALRFFLIVPVLPMYAFVTGVFGFSYYRTRLNPNCISSLRKKCKELKFTHVSLESPWFKEVEYYVINNFRNSVPGMYNYLVISGIFRSLSLIFLGCIWMEIYYFVHWLMTDHYHINILGTDKNLGWERLASFFALYIVYGFSASSYMKFQRRYAEETIFAFIFAKS